MESNLSHWTNPKLPFPTSCMFIHLLALRISFSLSQSDPIKPHLLYFINSYKKLFQPPDTGIFADGMWLGAKKVQGTLMWESSGTALTYSNLALGQPDGGSDEECMHMWRAGAAAGYWNDLSCSYSSQATMCEALFACS
jgi:hypothetical protein